MFCGVYFLLLASARATVRIVADPVPLSWTPGPAWTESRWAPAIATLSGLTPGRSAITFSVVFVTIVVSAAMSTVVPSRTTSPSL